MRRPFACRSCRRRSWLLGALAGHLDPLRSRIEELLLLTDPDLIAAAAAGSDRDTFVAAWGHFDADAARRAGDAAGLIAICKCDEGYPARLRELPSPPAVLHAAGDLSRLTALAGGASGGDDASARRGAGGPGDAPDAGGASDAGSVGDPSGAPVAGGASDAVAIVGARQASPYGRDVAGALAGRLATAGVTIVSGMALGIDAAAHQGALEVGGSTIAVLAGGADVPYPASHRRLHRRLASGAGLVISELGPGVRPRRWMFPARNRVIAALSRMTVVVQARERSGSLVTARWARALGRELGAVPGPVTTPLSRGPHRLIAERATLVAGAEDVLDALCGVGNRARAAAAPATLDPMLQRLLDALGEGLSSQGAFSQAGLAPDAGLAALAALELAGAVRRGPGGRYAVR